MEPLEFMRVVLPSAGYKCITELTSVKKERLMSEDVGALMDTVRVWNGQRKDSYMAMAGFENGSSRLSTNARYMRSLFLDIDCSHPKDIEPTSKAYPSSKHAVVALQQFLDDTGLGALGTPWVNSSGGGIHVFFPFTRDLTIAEWHPMAENLKRLCLQDGLKIDMGVTADASRVLRVPGTTNWGMKGGKQVRHETPCSNKLVGTLFDYDAMSDLLASKLNGHAYIAPALGLPGVRPDVGPLKAAILTTGNSVTSFRKIVDQTAKGSGCAQVQWYFAHATEDGMEPMWRAMLSLAKCCEDADKAARVISKAHPYDEARMLKKLAECKGPYPCTKIEAENPGGCEGCPHRGKITNPLQLGRITLTEDVPKQVEVPQPTGREPIVIERPQPPHKFSFGVNGGIYFTKQALDQNGVTNNELVEVLPYDLYIVRILKQREEHSAQFMAHRPEGATMIIIPMKSVISLDETLKALAAQNIMASSYAGKEGPALLHGFIRGSVEAYSKNRAPTKVPDYFGWQQDGSFVLSEREISPDGKSAHVPMPGMENISSNTHPTGTLENWRSVVNVFIRRELYGHLAYMTIGLGSPLMRFTGLRGMTFHAGSKESGTGKTQALDLAASIWGHPIDYRVGAGSSDVAMQQRAGLLHSLPLISDEITQKNRTVPDWLPGLLFSFSEGRGKERMESGANKERLNLSTWESLSALSSNTYVMDFLSSRAHSSHGEIFRVLEWTPEEKIEWSEDELTILRSLQQNYAVAGDKYARWLTANQDTAKRVVLETMAHIKTVMNTKSDERFWVAGIACCIAGAILAGEKYAGVVNLPVSKILPAFHVLVSNARDVLKVGHRSCEDILNSYTSEHYGSLIIAKDNVLSLGHVEPTPQSLGRARVMGRVESSKVTGWVDYYIPETLLKQFCTTRSYPYSALCRELQSQFRVSRMKKDLLQGTGGPLMRVSVLQVSKKMSELESEAHSQVAVE